MLPIPCVREVKQKMDIVVAKRIGAALESVANVMFDPRREPEWIGGVRSVQLLTGDPHASRARVKRHGSLLGFRFSWVTELVDYTPGSEMRMAIIRGPMQGEVIYRVARDGEQCLALIRSVGRMSAELPGAQWLVRRSVRRDLSRLARIVA
ncbi:SRPBCC family protein [Sphingomonas cavernae]|uniref:SRPBCC family protein n=1 Tax=Sphingomonas cavernae TaxID=2320861 RepID=A0A418WJR8_9SPHN|nr:SRPBCC family protein [Sphingomonas cavernae]RJF90291.1 hypothetical protein D3876_08450 [Sphingomonas cavernae]